MSIVPFPSHRLPQSDREAVAQFASRHRGVTTSIDTAEDDGREFVSIEVGAAVFLAERERGRAVVVDSATHAVVARGRTLADALTAFAAALPGAPRSRGPR
ncbi:MAG: hypothetical protein K2X46_17340 [Roseomonas sp.]|nr:hypothetical protein [Roseomonas sp.]